MKTKSTLPVVLGLAGALFLGSGCTSQEISAYDAPKDPRPEARPVRAGAPAAAPAVPEWDLPAGWTQLPGSGMRFATLRPDPADETLELRITPLGLMAKDALPNANRWAAQIGLAPLDESGLGDVLEDVRVATGQNAQVLDLVAPAAEDGAPGEQILAAILEGPDRVWFFMISGTTDAIAPHRGEFYEFVRSIRIGGGGGGGAASAGGANPAGGGAPPMGGGEAAPGENIAAAPAHAGITWEVPDGWREVAADVQFRVATLAGGNTETVITKFPGRVGSLLMNVNRWRGQLGLAPVVDLAETDAREVAVGPEAGTLVSMVGESGDGMRVAIVERTNFTWFLKQTGSAVDLEAQRGAFDAFIASIGFPGS